jgi:hypothetical protein
MSNPRPNLPALVLAACCVLLAQAHPAAAQKRDARSSADFTARTSVQTIYGNLIKAGYDWKFIRDEKLPELLVRSVDAVERETRAYDKRLILGTFIPTYIRSWYDEVDKLNAEHDEQCMTVKFIEITFVPFVEACARKFSGKFKLREIVVPVLEATYTFEVCDRSGCGRSLASVFNQAFASEQRAEKDFGNLCGSRG